MRLADADLLPFDFTDLATTVHQYVGELQKLLDGERQETVERDREIADGVFRATSDPRHPTVAPDSQAVPPYLDFAPLLNGDDALARSAQRYARAVAAARARKGPIGDAPLDQVNALLIRSERRLTDTHGLAGRPWYVHELYAPGFYTGYGVKTMPAVREPIEQRKFDEATDGIRVVGRVLQAEAALVDSVTAALGGP